MSTIAAIEPSIPISLAAQSRRIAAAVVPLVMERGDARQPGRQPRRRAQDLHRVADVLLGQFEFRGAQPAASVEQFLRQAQFADILQQADIAEQLDLTRIEFQEAAEGDHVDRHIERVGFVVFALLAQLGKKQQGVGIAQHALGHRADCAADLLGVERAADSYRGKHIVHQRPAAAVGGAGGRHFLLDARSLGVNRPGCDRVPRPRRCALRRSGPWRSTCCSVSSCFCVVSTNPWKMNGVSVQGRSSSAMYMPNRNSSTGIRFVRIGRPAPIKITPMEWGAVAAFCKIAGCGRRRPAAGRLLRAGLADFLPAAAVGSAPRRGRASVIRLCGKYSSRPTTGPGCRPGTRRRRVRPPLVLYFGGNAEEASWMLEELRNAPGVVVADRQLPRLRLERGLARRSGAGVRCAAVVRLRDEPSGADAKRIYRLRPQPGQRRGGGARRAAPARRPSSSSTPYDSLAAVAKRYYWYLPVDLLLKHRFDSIALAPAIRQPLLCLIAGARRGDSAGARASACSRPGAARSASCCLQEAGHNTTDSHPLFWPAIREFLAQKVD